jgi:hypothetical protein
MKRAREDSPESADDTDREKRPVTQTTRISSVPQVIGVGDS